MSSTTVGIGDLGLYVPAPRLLSESLVTERPVTPELAAKLRRALVYTGQRSIRFPEPWEDTTTMAAEAARIVLDRNRDALPGLRYLVVGTETGVDHSKPVAAYVQGLLQGAGYAVPESVTTFQVQHACAGGMLALLSVGALLGQGGRDGERGLVVSSDIARYEQGGTAEITQGAGAVSLLVERDPRLVGLDFATAGYASRDIDDFFRPLGSNTARVKGRLSIRAYREALESAFLDHCSRAGREPAAVLADTDMFVLHVPYTTLPLDALTGLVSKVLGLDEAGAGAFLAARGFQAALEPSAVIGNLYTSSMFLSLAYLLAERARVHGEAFAGKRILFGSYGSGNTMVVLSGTVAPRAAATIAGWDLARVRDGARQAMFAEYQRWMDGAEGAAAAEAPADRFVFLAERADGYREYRAPA